MWSSLRAGSPRQRNGVNLGLARPGGPYRGPYTALYACYSKNRPLEIPCKGHGRTFEGYGHPLKTLHYLPGQAEVINVD